MYFGGGGGVMVNGKPKVSAASEMGNGSRWTFARRSKTTLLADKGEIFFSQGESASRRSDCHRACRIG